MVDGFSSMDPRLAKGRQESAGQATARRRSSRRSYENSVKIDGGTVIINGQGYSVAPSLQASFIQQRTGGSGASATAAINLAKQIEAQRLAQQQAQAKLQEAQALREKQRILQQRSLLIAKGVQEKVQMSKDARTGDRLRVTSWRDNKGNQVQRYENLNKGTVKYQSFAVGRGGGGAKFTGAVTVDATPKGFISGGKVRILGDIIVPNIKEKPQNVVKVNPVTGITTEINQNTRNEISRLAKKNNKSYIDQAKILGFEFAIPFQEFGISLTQLPGFAKSLANNPKNIIKIPGQFWDGIKQSGTEILALAKVSPSRAVARIGGEVVLIVASGKAIKITGKVANKVANKINPFLKKVKNGKIVVRGTPSQTFIVKGKVRMLKSRVQKASIKRPFSSAADFLKGRKPGQFKKFTKDPGLALKLQTVKTGATSLSKQAALAGREITAVNAAAQQLTSWLKRKKIIRKPLPNQLGNPKNYSVFPKRIGNLIKKFDDGTKLTTREFADVNMWLQKNVAANITLLERSLYLDPASGLRVSRLGIQEAKSATIRDILKGNFRLWSKSGKPQILVFENAKVAKFPKSLTTVKRKLLAGKKLTVAETNKLIEWQVRTGSGKFKPIGSTIYQGGIELEVTLAPGELIKRIKRVGTTVIENRRVPIVTAEIFKPTQKLLLQIKKANLGKLTNKQLITLEKSLSKKLGRKIRIETPSLKSAIRKSVRMADVNTPVLRVRGGSILVSRLLGRTRAIIKEVRNLVKRSDAKRATRTGVKRVNRITKRPGRLTPKRPGRLTPKRPGRLTPKRPGRLTPKRPGRPIIPRPSRPGKTKPPVQVRIKPKDFTSNSLSKKVQTYYVVEKVRGKFKKLYPKPLTAKDAKDYAVYSIDNRLSKTAFFVPLGKSKKVLSPPKNIQGYYSRNSIKVRPYKIRYGIKKQMVNGFIEKRKYFQDTIGEKLQASKLRRNSVKRKVVRRKISGTQRSELLNRLKKARAVRMKNLKRKR